MPQDKLISSYLSHISQSLVALLISKGLLVVDGSGKQAKGSPVRFHPDTPPSRPQMGPRFGTYIFMLNDPTAAKAMTSSDMAQFLEVALDSSGVAVTQKGMRVFVTFSYALKALHQIVGFDTLGGIGIGVSGSNHVMQYRIDDYPHHLIAGTTGSGKSTFMQAMIAQLINTSPLERTAIYIIDPHNDAFEVFNGCPHLRRDVIVSQDEIAATLEAAATLCRTRRTYGYNVRKVPDLLRVYIFIDEAQADDVCGTSDTRKAASPEGKKRMTANIANIQIILKEGRKYGVHMVIGTQRPNAADLSGIVIEQLGARWLGYVATAKAAGDLGGSGVPLHKLMPHGDMMMVKGSDVIRFQAVIVQDWSWLPKTDAYDEDLLAYIAPSVKEKLAHLDLPDTLVDEIVKALELD